MPQNHLPTILSTAGSILLASKFEGTTYAENSGLDSGLVEAGSNIFP